MSWGDCRSSIFIVGFDRYKEVLADVLKDLADKNASANAPTVNIDKDLYLLKIRHHQVLWTSYNTALFFHSGKLKPSDTAGFQIISPSLNFPHIQELFMQSTPSLTVVSNFLTPGALNFLYNHCLESTFWYTTKQGCLGAHHDDRLSHPVLEQLVVELSKKFSKILKGHRLTNLWAYKSSQDHTGVPVHADDASVSFNIYVDYPR